MKKLLGIISLLTLVLGCLLIPTFANAESNPSPTAGSVPKVETVVVTDANGQQVEADPYKMYSYGEAVSEKVTAEIKTNMTKANEDITKTNDLGDICGALDDVAKNLNENYDGSVFEVTDLFEFSYDLQQGQTITVTFEIDTTEDSACMHLVNGTTWKVAESSQRGNSLTVTFDELCPVAIVTVSAAKVAALSAPSTHSDVAFYVIIAILVIIILLLLVKMYLDSKAMKEAIENQNSKIAECEEKAEKAEQLQKEAIIRAQEAARKAEEEKKANEAPLEKIVETEAVVGVPVEVDEVTGSRYFSVSYNRSFTAKLIKASDEAKEYYSELRNEIESYGSKGYTNWKFDNYRVGRAFPIKLAVRGKTLCAYYALDPKSFDGTKYNVEDVSDSATYSSTPTLMRVSGSRKIKHAKELVAKVMEKYDRTKAETEKIDYIDNFADTDEKDLIARGLIKVNVIKSDVANERGTSIEIQTEASKVSVNDLVDDRTAQNMIKISDRVADPTKQITVLTDVLADNFENGETVNLASLKDRVEGFDQEATWYQILPGAALDKQLTVDCDGYSLEAVKMVILVGGTVICSKDAE